MPIGLFNMKKGEQSKMCRGTLLDYFLPDMNGLDFLHRCMAFPVFPPIIIVTGQSDERIAVQAIKGGAADYIIKSGDYFSTIGHVIERTLEQERLRQRAVESENRYRTIVDQAISGVFQSTLDGSGKFLHKPYRPEELVRTVREVLDGGVIGNGKMSNQAISMKK